MIVYKLGPFFVHGIRLRPKTDRFHTNVTHETEEPYRYGRCLIWRYWGRRGVVVGRWEGRFDTEEKALLAGVYGHEESAFDNSGQLLERYKARKQVAQSSRDVDDEWVLMNALDIMDDA